MKRKIFLIAIKLLIILFVLLIISKFVLLIISNKEIYIEYFLEYDMKITWGTDGPRPTTALAVPYEYILVNTKKNISYVISQYFETYNINKIKLTDDQVNKLIEYANKPSDYGSRKIENKNTSDEKDFLGFNGTYIDIIYNDKNSRFYYSTAKEILEYFEME